MPDPTRTYITDEPALTVTPAARYRGRLTGRRVIVRTWLGGAEVPQDIRDMRAVSEPQLAELEGVVYVRVVDEASWYAWQADTSEGKPGVCPKAIAVPIDVVWVEGV